MRRRVEDAAANDPASRTWPDAGAGGSRPGDWFLQSLVSLVNHRPHLRLGIVLHVHGLEISGSLVSGTAYFERFARAFPDALDLADQAQRQTAHDSIAMHAARYGSRNADDSTDPPDYLHLIDVRVTAAGSADAMAPALPLWRGRIDAIDGFQLQAREAGAGVSSAR
ncbi:gas vesicle protein [Stenotrophomonas sp. Sa5BUN4]|uniref:Gas vesicle protein n=1 Tax=Stenotrophomonas lacuserhaii TaxID=2760084 RepID=A0A8X8FJL0_9GAMM|nr:hypothetical protein [Stenotrophomonas pennii]MBD7953023.1 gas vesicle protein [Stenotrophomonas pennii]